MADAQIRAVITAKDDASAVLNNFANSGQASFAKLTGAFATGQAIFYGVENAIRKVGDVIGQTVSQAETWELVTTRLQTGINNVRSASDKNIDSLLKQAQALQGVTRFSDDAIVSAQGILSTFQLNQSQIQTLTPHLIDMAEGIAKVSGTMPDLETNAMLVAKAVGGEDVTGLTGALRRNGVIFTKYQEEILKTGTFQQRLSTISQVLADNFNNMGVAAGQTTAGKIAILQHHVEDAQKSIGLALLPTISMLADKLSVFVQSDKFQAWIKEVATWLGDNLPKFINWLTNTGIPTMVTAWNEVGKPILNVIMYYIHFEEAVSRAIGTVAYGVTTMILWFQRLPGHVEAVVNRIISLFGGIPDALGRAFKSVLPAPITALAHTLHVPGFAAGVQNFSGGLAIVGERGPELVNLPGGSDVIPNGQLGNTYNISLNANAFMGSPVEARQFAQQIVNNIKDIAARKNMTGSDYLAAPRNMV